jgi:hypothetical protein
MTVLPLMYFFMMCDKKRQCYPLCIFSWRDKNQHCYPLCFIQQWAQKTTVLPLMFYLTTTNKKRQCYPLCFLSMTKDKKQQCYPLCFFSMTKDKKRQCSMASTHRITGELWPVALGQRKIKRVVFFMFFSMTSDKKRQCYPLCFIWRRPIKSDSVTPHVFFHDVW